MRHHLTDTTIHKLAAPDKGNRIYFDTLLAGFGLRVTANDARVFVLDYRSRADRRQRRLTIGNIETWSTATARERARKLKREVDAGKDPLGEIEQERAAPTINDLIDRYVAEHLPRKRPRSRIEDERLLPIIRDALGREKVASVTYTHIDRLHRTVTEDRGPFRANRVLAVLSKMFSLAVKWRMRPDNPVVGVQRNAEPKRERFLSRPELDRLLDALVAEEDTQAANVIRLLLLTGARSAEALGAEWDQIDLAEGLWIKPHTMTKQAEEHRLPLSDEAVALLASIRETAPAKARYVFPGATPFKPRHSIRHAWDRIREAAGLGDMRVHDLRHSHASFLVNAGFSLPVIGGLLGHKTPSTTARYAHLSDAAMRAATKSVGSVVSLRRRAK
ncbi:tyrosine-type recombinase/integrase [Methyloceanibacter sp.]|uniref:tyrosine-type recombinase/integrase n=1 Tax=Methyloceanibacter sp. TaxID=1965321 RepID=UPI00351BC2A2